METNYFNCKYCDKFTRHIELSARESSALLGDNSIADRVMSTIVDLTGTREVINTFAGKRFWKCCECGAVTRRNASGTDDLHL